MKTANRIILRNDRIVGADLNVRFYYGKECNDVIARFDPLMITTSGKDLSHAKEMFKEAFELWLETVSEDGNARWVLENLGWKLKKREKAFIKRSELSGWIFLFSNRLNILSVVWERD